jgi:hypothetical protein
MADDASYLAFLQKANQPLSPPSSATATTVSLDEPTSSKHPYLSLLNNKLGGVISKTFTTETDSDFRATFISSAALPSWSDSTSEFPAATDLEGQVDQGWDGKMMGVEEWDTRGEYTAIVQAIKDVTKQNKAQVYTVQGKGACFEVFILAKVDDGLVGVKAKGVET